MLTVDMKTKSKLLVIIFICILLLLQIPLAIKNLTASASSEEYCNATDKSIFGDNALIADSAKNQSEKLQNCIATARDSGKSLYIPSGTYIITESMPRCFYDIKITGDADGATIIKNGREDGASVVFGEYGDYSRHDNVEISNLFFDGVGISFRKADNAKFYGNVFYNFRSKFIIELQIGKNMQIYNNVFLRDKAHTNNKEARCVYVGGYGFGKEEAYGKPMTFAEDVYIRDNIFGAKIGELDGIADRQSEACKATVKRLQKSINNKTVNLPDEQNILTTGINSFYCLKNAYIEDNYFYSCYDDYFDAQTDKAELPCNMDHVTYIRGAQDIFMSGNYSRGWHNGQGGGFKFKSSNKITIVKNYFINTGIIMSNHAEQGCEDILTAVGVSSLKNWLIADNIFDSTQTHGAYGTGIYFEVDNPEKVQTVVEDIVILNNRYINYKNLPAHMRLDIRFGWTDKADGSLYFTPENTCSLNNTRDDTEDGVLKIDGWKEEDYAAMRTDWRKMLSDAPEMEKYYTGGTAEKSNVLPIVFGIAVPVAAIITLIVVLAVVRAKRRG